MRTVFGPPAYGDEMIRPLLTHLLVLGTALSQAAPLGIDAAQLRQRRALIAADIADAHPGRRVVVVMRGGRKQADMGAFSQDQDFFYLTGVSEPNLAMLLAISADGDLEHEELLVPPHSPFSAKWDGRFLAPGARAAEATGFKAVGNVNSLGRKLKQLLKKDETEIVVVTNTRPAARLGSTPSKASQAAKERRTDPFDGRHSREEQVVAAIKEIAPDVEVVSLERFVHRARPHKSQSELALIRRSTELAAEGIGEAMRSCKPGAYEYQLAAVARCIFSLNGCGPDAYAAIVGGGPNGCILHYNACTRQLQPDDLIVMDYAATLDGYCSDVTRTFPASGKFTAEQRKLVSDVYDVQQLLLAEVKPGASLRSLSRMCAKALVERGYRNDHGPCHHVGLAVHDPSVDKLEAGMVITVEPGAYLPKKGFGCRIEDCVLVTKDGCEVMSKNVPSHPDAIEAWMAKPPRIPLDGLVR